MSLFFALISIITIFNDVHAIDNTDSAKAENRTLFTAPSIPKDAFLCLFFQSEGDLQSKMVLSQAKKESSNEENIAKYDGQWRVEVPANSAVEGDYALILKSKAKHHAISIPLAKPIDFTQIDTLVVQYDVKFQNGMECGGSYVKLLAQGGMGDLKEFRDTSPYTIMFGPDRCGHDNKLHFIIRYKNPVSGEFEEKHAKKPKNDFAHVFTDAKTHLFTLILREDSNFEIYIDEVLVNSGSLLSDLEPAITPPKEIDDPSDVKPVDWDDRATIVDESATKPDDWDESQEEMVEDVTAVKPQGWLDDEPLLVPDTTSERPADWDAAMDGEWEPRQVDNPRCKEAPGCGPWSPPKIKNPLYKGPWKAPTKANPAYKGIWTPRKVANPAYFEDSRPFVSLGNVGALGLELWTMSDEVAFDSFILTSDRDQAALFGRETWGIKRAAEKRANPAAQSVVEWVQEKVTEQPLAIGLTVLLIFVSSVVLCYFCCRSGASSSNEDLKESDEEEKKMEQQDEIEEQGEVTGAGDRTIERGDLESSDEDEEVNGEKNEEEVEEEEGETEEEVIETTTVTKKRVKKSS